MNAINIRRTIFIIVTLLLCLNGTSQNIIVKSFQALPMDMAASSLEGKRIDQNGEVAALIKIVTSETGFTFEAGTLGIVDSKQETGEVWVWVPQKSKKITIKHQQLGVLRDYRYPIEIEPERTYEMILTTAKVVTTIEEEVREQYLIFRVEPKDAMLEVDDQLWPVSADGIARKLVKFGTYTYRVQAPNYYPEAGSVTVDDPNNKKTVPVNLRPNFGWVEVKGGNVQDAAVYIDNAYIGKAPCKSDILKSGEHTVRIARAMYAPYTERVVVKDNETTILSPELTADFARVTLTVEGDAEIWVNDERKGTRTWTGELASGTYRMECRLANHEPSSITKEIANTMDGETITLPAPKPIYGSLNVESTPDFARIFVDGKAMGETPNFISQILIGQHELKLTKDGYADYTETVTIAKGERKQVTATLSNGKEIQFTCNVPNAQLEIDGQRVGSANGTYMLIYGSHSLKVTATDYHDYTYTLAVSDSDNNRHSIMMLALRKAPEGALPGVFSVSATQKVHFAKGNLQYQASTNTWRFAENQWDMAGKDNKKISSRYKGWIDLFCWGTGDNPSKKSDISEDYSHFSDWGREVDGDWCTLTQNEWTYVFENRRTISGVRYAKAMVNSVNGVILLPDDWSTSYFSLNYTNESRAQFASNIISSSTWNNVFEPVGAVFLPASGMRYFNDVTGIGSKGGYWSASTEDTLNAFVITIVDWSILVDHLVGRLEGHSVRLVCPVEN